MKRDEICITVGDYLDHEGFMSDGREIFKYDGVGAYSKAGQFIEFVEDGNHVSFHGNPDVNYMHIEECFVKVPITIHYE